MLRVPDRDLTGPIDVDSVAGGCLPLINVKAAEQAGYPDARLFFGLEELDFCLRVRRAGYRIVADGGLMRARREARGRLGWKRPVLPRAAAWAAPWRQYYSTRNYVFFMRETFARPDLARLWAARAVAKALLAVARHPREGRALSAALLRGVRDGHASRMGRTVEPVAKGSGDG